jgi:hypothetical protein
MNNPTELRQKLESLTADELRKQAREAGHSGVSRLKKEELVKLLMEPVEAPEQAGARQVPLEGSEKRRRLPGVPGRWLQLAAVVGVILSLAITLVLPAASLWAGARLKLGLESASSGLESAAGGVNLAAANLDSSIIALGSASQALRSANQSLRSIDPLLDSLSELLADDLPATIETTQKALVSAEDGAAAMDRVLRGLRLLGLNYNPELPLDQSLAQTAASLEGLPDSLRQTEQDLGDGQQDLVNLAVDLSSLGRDLDKFSDDLGETAIEMEELGQVMLGAAGTLQLWSGRITWLRWLVAAAALLFGLWLLALNVNMWMVGSMVRRADQ